MLEIKSFFGDWKEATKEQAEAFYKTFQNGSTAIKADDKHKYFNEHHIRGGHVLLSGEVETAEEQKERMFKAYKKILATKGRSEEHLNNPIRFNCIEYLCSLPGINPYEMAASIIQSGYMVLYDDSSINRLENEKKKKRVNKLIKVLDREDGNYDNSRN